MPICRLVRLPVTRSGSLYFVRHGRSWHRPPHSHIWFLSLRRFRLFHPILEKFKFLDRAHVLQVRSNRVLGPFSLSKACFHPMTNGLPGGNEFGFALPWFPAKTYPPISAIYMKGLAVSVVITFRLCISLRPKVPSCRSYKISSLSVRAAVRSRASFLFRSPSSRSLLSS